MPKMIDSMQKEFENRFRRGIAASPGIVIGKAYVFEVRDVAYDATNMK
jgi:hypothetical protein